MLAAMTDNSSVLGYILLTPQLISIGHDEDNAQLCKFATIMD
jgi:hypothetical protein